MAVAVLDAFTSEVDAEPNGSPTISAGSKRAALLCLHAEHGVSSIVVSTMTIGGQTYTQAYEFEVADGADDMYIYVYLWNESSISSMSGTTISYADDETLTKRGWSFGTYSGVNQSSFPKVQAEVGVTGNETSTDITTTSSAGDRIIVFAMAKNPVTLYSTWDTLSEVVDASPSGMQMAVGEGDGGDNTTTVVVDTSTSQSFNAIVLGGGIQAQAMYHYRNHGTL